MSDHYNITIFAIYSKGELEKQLSKKVNLKYLYNSEYDELSKTQKILIPLKILFLRKSIYKKYIKENYDFEISFLEGPVTRLFSTKNKKVKKIAWIHNDISKVYGKGIKAKIKKKLDRKIYSKFNTLVFVSRDNLKNFNKEYKDLRNEYLEPVKKEVIYNYIDKEIVIQKAKEKINIIFDKDKLNFLTVARLVPQKAIGRLINVHEKLINEGIKHNFFVVGDGPEKENLENMINKKHLEDTFHLLGKKENPYPYMKEADYFCLLSEFEGYGMVLEEAKILGKSIIITDTAAREAVEKYKNSIILENTEEGIYKGIKKIILRSQKKVEQKNDIEYDNQQIIENIKRLLEEK